MTTNKAFQYLATAVINRAMQDLTGKTDVSEPNRQDAIWFLNNSYALAFYADIAGCQIDLEKQGYLKRG